MASSVAKLASILLERARLLRERAEARATELALRDANRRMDEFLGIASHELRTPLTTIKANIQLAGRQLKKLVSSAPVHFSQATRSPGSPLPAEHSGSVQGAEMRDGAWLARQGGLIQGWI